jgi:hypothetical protein
MHDTFDSVADAEAPQISALGERAPPTLKAVRRHCLDCCNGSAKEVELCPAKRCPLWTMRFGRRPDPAEYIDDPTKRYPLESQSRSANSPQRACRPWRLSVADASTARGDQQSKPVAAASRTATFTPSGSAGTQTEPGSGPRPSIWHG